MDMKAKLAALGYKPGQLKGKDDAALQAMHDTKVLELREQGLPLPWEGKPPIGGDGGAGDGGAGDGGAGDGGAGDGGAGDSGAGDSGAGDSGAGDGGAGDGGELDELLDQLQPVTARFGFKFTAPDVLRHGDALVLPGRQLDVAPGDDLLLSEATKNWLWKQGLIKG
ncbi:hypothetical protein [Aeromonas sp. QDB22]|uniref:hypothetical protein n=1 Tax=Aeromonas sp. QDB22 TaxID=2989834 RepID=UPI0022E51EB9|nr:hypothetical protein [Aeromonas sp. QDB22]